MSLYQLPIDRRPALGYWAAAGLRTQTYYNTDGPTINVVTDPTYGGADDSGATDSHSEVTAAFAAAGTANNGTVVYFPAGTYTFGAGLGTPSTGGGNWPQGNFKIRGEVDADGNSLVIWKFTMDTPSAKGFTMGASFDRNPSRPVAAISSGLTQGSTQIVVASDPGFVDHGQGHIRLATDPAKTWHVYDNGSGVTPVEFFCVKVTAKAGNTLTLDQMIPENYSAVQRTGATFMQWEFGMLSNFGIENIIIDGTECDDMTVGLELMGRTVDCWIKNVRILGHGNYALSIYDSSHLLVEDCWIEQSLVGGSNHAGILINTVSQSLFRHNIVERNTPCWEINSGTVGCVFAYNYSPDANSGLCWFIHGPQNNQNIYEGNIAPTFLSDGYFGGDRAQFLYRNWFFAYLPYLAVDTFCIAFKRFSRQDSAVGNICQRPAYAGGNVPYSLGGVGSTSPVTTAQPSLGDWWSDTINGVPRTWTGTLTRRDSAEAGQITLGAGQGASLQTHKTNSSSNLAGWAGQQITLGTIVGDVVEVSNAALPLPGLGPITLSVSNDGFMEEDLDVAATFEKKANYNYNADEIPAGEALAVGETLPDSFYLTEADARFSAGGVAWPPFNPFSPNPAHSDIPAGYRFLNDAWPAGNVVGTPTFSPSPGDFETAQNIEIDCPTVDAVCRFTSDGSEPTPASPEYTTPIALALPSTTTLKARAFKSGMTDSAIRSGLFTIAEEDEEPPPPPDPPPGDPTQIIVTQERRGQSAAVAMML